MIPRVYQAINAIAGALARDGVAKTRLNARDNYLYRSIDDVLERIAPLLAEYRLCILPRVLERHAADRHDEAGDLLINVVLKVAFDLVSTEDSSCHVIEAYGEALDGGDKATAKAMQSAYKYAVLQAFCVPATHVEDADRAGYRLQPAPPLLGEPAEGWEKWCEDLHEGVRVCPSCEAVDQLQEAHRACLAALARERPDLYRVIGETFGAQRTKLTPAGQPGKVPRADEATKAGPRPRRPVASIAPPPPGKRAVQANGSGAHG